MSQTLRFAINRMAVPRQAFPDFVALVKRLRVDAIEIRNDLEGVEMRDGTAALRIGAMAREAGLVIRSINALQRFDQWNAQRETEAHALVRYAAESGTQALVLCPTNDRQDARSPQQRHDDLVHALTQLRPLLEAQRLTGLVEPLGFAECAVRRKSQAVRAFEAIGGAGPFRLVHDTFHHHLAGEDLFYPELTGLVHISGVDEPALAVDEMRDAHRVLVGAADRLGNVAQLQRLLAAGYAGYVSFEPFAEEVAASSGIEAQLAASMAWLRAQLEA
jgi:2-keto-myo-inositol isomerase